MKDVMNYERRVRKAVKHFWEVRTRQHENQGSASGRKDAGFRSAVTAGKHLDGFVSLFAHLLSEAGVPDSSIHTHTTTLPGYFRPSKNWDLVVVSDGALLASIEFKAHVGPSFGNNFNNRVEEAVGNSSDLLTAYREGKFAASCKPWLGWLMLLEDCPRSRSPVRVDEPHFDAFAEFRDASYVERYRIFCERLMRERLYDAACLVLSEKKVGLETGRYREPDKESNFAAFADSLIAHASAFSRRRARH
jgi:hypothetical protein